MNNLIDHQAINVWPTESRKQQGSTLLVSLVMLLLITLLAVSSMQGSILEERMASNAHDSALAFQAAEAALRQGEGDLSSDPGNQTNAAGITRLNEPWAWDGNVDRADELTTIDGLSGDPAYHYAQLGVVCTPETPPVCFKRFEVTARAQGGSLNAVTVLQSTVLLP